jgi:hypothetical protein
VRARRASVEPSTRHGRARQAELQGASESFRNSTLLIAIRDRGYVCADLTSVAPSGDELGGWHVACRDALAYFVAVDATGELVVEPVAHWDGVPLRAPPENDR